MVQLIQYKLDYRQCRDIGSHQDIVGGRLKLVQEQVDEQVEEQVDEQVLHYSNDTGTVHFQLDLNRYMYN